MKKLVLITGHFAVQKRQSSLLFISRHLQANGWHVTHATVGYSCLSKLRRDARLQALEQPPKIGTQVHNETLTSVFSLPLLHPVNLRRSVLNTLSEKLWPLFIRHWRQKLHSALRKADVVICESGPPILLAQMLKDCAPHADRIYRVNDDIRLLNVAPGLIRQEQSLSQSFTRISTASPVLAKRFTRHPNLTIDPMGIPHEYVDRLRPSPFCKTSGRKVAVCAGTTQMDYEAVTKLVNEKPLWDIHIFGRHKASPPTASNLTWHGEQDYETTLASVSHADIGLAPYVDSAGIEYQSTNSNRMLLYRHFGLPILGPARLCRDDMPNIFEYNDLRKIEYANRKPERIPDWSELAESLVQNGVTDPPNEVETEPDT